MCSNVGGLVGSNVLRGDDAPLYRTGFRVCVVLVSVGLLIGICQHLQYRWSNRKIEQQRQADPESVERDGFVWKYTL